MVNGEGYSRDPRPSFNRPLTTTDCCAANVLPRSVSVLWPLEAEQPGERNCDILSGVPTRGSGMIVHASPSHPSRKCTKPERGDADGADAVGIPQPACR